MDLIRDSLLAEAAVPAVLVDRENRIRGANRAFRRLLGGAGPAQERAAPLDAFVRLDPSEEEGPMPADRVSIRRCVFLGKGDGKEPSHVLVRIPCRTGDGENGAVLLLAEPQRSTPSPDDLHVARLASLGKLLAGIIHEISNPLSVINGCAQLLEASKDLPRSVTETVRRIRSEAQRTSDLVRRVLSFARKNRDVKERFPLQDALEEATVLKHYALKNKNIRLQIAGMPSQPLLVEGFRSRLIQVLLNLINNAEQAITGAGGEGTITLRLDVVENRAVVEIHDSGPGIPPEQQDRIFEAFFTTKERGEGTGMGLYLSRKIVRDHGGDLCLLSGEAGGTTFRFTLPLQEESGTSRKEGQAIAS